MTARTVTAGDGTALHVEVTGSGPPVVLLHGGPGLWDYLRPLADLLPGRTAIRFDQRGCGRSGGTDGPFTLDVALADVEAVRAALGVGRWTLAVDCGRTRRRLEFQSTSTESRSDSPSFHGTRGHQMRSGSNATYLAPSFPRKRTAVRNIF